MEVHGMKGISYLLAVVCILFIAIILAGAVVNIW